LQKTPEIRTWRVLNLEMPVDGPESSLRETACRAAGIDRESLRGMRIARKSLDARKRGGERRLRFVYHVDLLVDARYASTAFESAKRSGKVREAPEAGSLSPERAPRRSGLRVVVVGAGPGGLYAATVLSRAGVQVDLVDRGGSLESRGTDLVSFHRSRHPNPESNLLFGEGGAGTYSDGKLYTRVDHPLELACLEELVDCGAPPEIVYDSRAHIGTDRLHRILPEFRNRLAGHGVRFHWNCRMEGLEVAPGTPARVAAVETSLGSMPCDAVILSTGHSARDTWEMLLAQGVELQAKPFQLGVRIEHPQELVDRGRYGDPGLAKQLGVAAYNLVFKGGDGCPPAHSFCMCPGGRIVASINAAGELCTNGMSNAAHSSGRANAAIVTTFGPREFGDQALDGVRFQRGLERRFFEAGGSDYTAPAQTASDFLARRETPDPGRTTYTFGVCPGRIDALVPERARDAIAAALVRFDRTIPGFAGPDGILVGLESRSSGPVRVVREPDTRTARGFSNLYPVGEGAGYAGGIMSAALDGADSALAFLEL
jgi:uncharacterized FAD-dependent dehydrogenase